MSTVYIIQNQLTNRYYIGSTNDLIRRVSEHDRGQNKSTRKQGVWVVVYTETYTSVLEAKKRERQIKSYKGGNAFKKLIMRV